MLKGYLDASETDPTKDVIAIAEWVAAADHWTPFDECRTSFLGEFGLQR